jgi:hypothetical protein
MMQEERVVNEKVRQEVEHVANEKHLASCAELVPGFCCAKKFYLEKKKKKRLIDVKDSLPS